MHPERTIEGLLSNHQIAGTGMGIYSDSDLQNQIDSHGLEYQPGNYTIQYSVEVIESDTHKNVSSNYDLRPSTCKLTVSEPTDTFTVTIPATASVNEGEIRIEYRIDGTFDLKLTVSSENDWELQADGKPPIAYTLMDGGDIPVDQGYLLGYQERNLSLFLTPTPDGNPDPGTYEDTLTFTVHAYK